MTRLNNAGIESRRSLLRRAVPAAAAALWLRPGVGRAEPEGEDDRIAEVQARGKAAGLALFRVSRADRFLGLGDAPDSFREGALEICAALGRLFLSDLRARGFKLDYPDERLMVVVLKDSRSYEALLGEAPGIDVGGHFDLNSNRLVIFDFRPGREATPGAERMNTFTLVHETVHLLSFNTGLLSLDREPPKCVAEGLATCFEMWRPRNRAGVGAINRPRLQAIRDSDETWIDVARLLADDAVLDREETAQLAYGQSWMLVYSLLKNRPDQPKLRAYLEEIRAPGSPPARLKSKKRGQDPFFSAPDPFFFSRSGRARPAHGRLDAGRLFPPTQSLPRAGHKMSEAPTAADAGTKFDNNGQYSRNSILRYEKIFGAREKKGSGAEKKERILTPFF